MTINDKERDIIAHLAGGLGIKEIAPLVGLSYVTTQNYVKYARMKLGAQNTAHLVSLAYKNGILKCN